MLIYIHGFRTGIRDETKISTYELLAKHLDVGVVTINYDILDPVGSLARMIEEFKVIEKNNDIDDDMLIMGSSLGGFMAAVLASKVGCKLVMFNPTFKPEETLRKYKGQEILRDSGKLIKFTTDHAKAFAKWNVDDTLHDLTNNGFGALFIVTDDDVIDPSYAVDKMKALNSFGAIIVKYKFKGHRLTEDMLLDMREDIIGYYYAMCG